ncbi:MAG TPA: XdhC family protein, partial [Woeseiaceae bacterium]|nr:XdhC family protein [Woeseiaceae bacterium]
ALSRLDCNIRWIDNRGNMFRNVPGNVRTIEANEPALEVAAMPPDSYYLVMTHSHALDFDICERILWREDARYCGLIGSLSKRRRFEKRYRQQGMPQAIIDALVCPIGVDGISGKKPAEIAVAAAAEILKIRERAADVAVAEYPDNVHPIRR